MNLHLEDIRDMHSYALQERLEGGTKTILLDLKGTMLYTPCIFCGDLLSPFQELKHIVSSHQV